MLVNTVLDFGFYDFRSKIKMEPGLNGSLAALEPESSASANSQFRVIYFLWTIFNITYLYVFVNTCKFL